MKRPILLAALAITVVLLLLVLLGATHHLSRPKLDERLAVDPRTMLVIAPREDALTFARIGSGERSRVLLVTHADGQYLHAVDLEARFGRPFRDTVEAFAAIGFGGLASEAAGSATIQIRYEDLTLPVEPLDVHIAAGTNFREHAEEVGHEEGPFLFPKLSAPTAWNADVPDRARLDYEAELCAVTLAPHTSAEPARFGFVLCNDFTDRWTLVRGMDFDAPMGTTGFPDGKGGEGMLPIGPLLVVPRDAEAFHRDLVLELYVDGALRQRAVGAQMIWPPSEIVARALADCDVAHRHEQGTMPLTDCAGIPARTLILTGTPGGVLFHPVTLWSKRAYLGPGDEVVTVASHLGFLRNRVR
jgi:2,4-diketo-3-deoxy-L-fuconate hydrolase